jgi:integrase
MGTESKPAKPYPDFPLFPHDTKRWAKKIRGKMHYFGSWNDPQAALKKYLEQRDDLHAGRVPRIQTGGPTILDLMNRFLAVKEHLVETGELSNRTFLDYRDTAQRVCDIFDKTRLVDDLSSQDFEHLRQEFAKTRGLVALGNQVQRVRVIFKYAYDAQLVDKPVRFGPDFKRPNRKSLRNVRQLNGSRMFEAEQLHNMLAATDKQLKAMFLLGINCAFGNNDCGTLPTSALDLEKAWVTFPRPKTAIQRRCPLWPETIEAIREAIAARPSPKDESHKGLVFITKYGHPWAKDTPDSPITKETTKLLKSLEIHRRGLGFYALRHTFETVAGESRDQVAVDFIMGHSRPEDDMASQYRERISDDRLIAVTNFVHRWLFGDQSSDAGANETAEGKAEAK